MVGAGGIDEADQAAAAFGLQIEGGRPEIAIWPEFVQAVDCFAAMLTQWRIGAAGGVIGLDYTAIPPTLEMMGVARAEWPELFMQLRIMENEAIKVMNE